MGYLYPPVEAKLYDFVLEIIVVWAFTPLCHFLCRLIVIASHLDFQLCSQWIFFVCVAISACVLLFTLPSYCLELLRLRSEIIN